MLFYLILSQDYIFILRSGTFLLDRNTIYRHHSLVAEKDIPQTSARFEGCTSNTSNKNPSWGQHSTVGQTIGKGVKVCRPLAATNLSQPSGSAHRRPPMKRPLQNNPHSHGLGAAGEKSLLEVPRHGPDSFLS